jgi:hypothetical protein
VKQWKLETWDDLHCADGEQVAADTTVTLAFGGRAVELDLTGAHADELAKLLAPWLDAGQPAGKAAPSPGTPRAGRTRTARGTWLRAWCEERGIEWRKSSGKAYFPKAARNAWDAHLRGQGGAA